MLSLSPYLTLYLSRSLSLCFSLPLSPSLALPLSLYICTHRSFFLNAKLHTRLLHTCRAAKKQFFPMRAAPYINRICGKYVCIRNVQCVCVYVSFQFFRRLESSLWLVTERLSIQKARKKTGKRRRKKSLGHRAACVCASRHRVTCVLPCIRDISREKKWHRSERERKRENVYFMASPYPEI